jgi:hypothetical protein
LKMEEAANYIPLGVDRGFGRERRGSTSNVPTSISKRRLSVGDSILDRPKVIGATPGKLSHFCILEF